MEGRLSLDCILTDETQSVNRKLKSISHQKKKSGNKLKKSTLLIGAGLAAAGASIILLGKSSKKQNRNIFCILLDICGIVWYNIQQKTFKLIL